MWYGAGGVGCGPAFPSLRQECTCGVLSSQVGILLLPVLLSTSCADIPGSRESLHTKAFCESCFWVSFTCRQSSFPRLWLSGRHGLGRCVRGALHWVAHTAGICGLRLEVQGQHVGQSLPSEGCARASAQDSVLASASLACGCLSLKFSLCVCMNFFFL